MCSSSSARVFCLYYICTLTKRISGFSFPCAFIFFTAHVIHWGCQYSGPKPRRWEQIALPFTRYLSCTYALEPSLHTCLPAYEVMNVPSSGTTNDFKCNSFPSFILTVWNGIMTLECSITANWALPLFCVGDTLESIRQDFHWQPHSDKEREQQVLWELKSALGKEVQLSRRKKVAGRTALIQLYNQSENTMNDQFWIQFIYKIIWLISVFCSKAYFINNYNSC